MLPGPQTKVSIPNLSKTPASVPKLTVPALFEFRDLRLKFTKLLFFDTFNGGKLLVVLNFV